MKLNKNSWHARFYKKSYVTEELPKTICNYFCNMFFAIVLLPITWWTYFPNGLIKFEDVIGRCVGGIVIPLFIFMSGVPFMGILGRCGVNLENVNNVLFVIIFFIGGLIMIALLFLILWGCKLYLELYKEAIRKTKVKKREPKPNVIKEYFKNVKEKNCSIINWEDDGDDEKR